MDTLALTQPSEAGPSIYQTNKLHHHHHHGSPPSSPLLPAPPPSPPARVVRCGICFDDFEWFSLEDLYCSDEGLKNCSSKDLCDSDEGLEGFSLEDLYDFDDPDFEWDTFIRENFDDHPEDSELDDSDDNSSSTADGDGVPAGTRSLLQLRERSVDILCSHARGQDTRASQGQIRWTSTGRFGGTGHRRLREQKQSQRKDKRLQLKQKADDTAIADTAPVNIVAGPDFVKSAKVPALADGPEDSISVESTKAPVSGKGIVTSVLVDGLDASGSIEALKLGGSLHMSKDHAFCLECLTRHVDTMVKAHAWPIYCPHESCREVVSSFAVETLLGSEAIQWHNLGVEHAIKKKIYCPNVACGRLIDGDLNNEQEAVDRLCPYCNRPFCAMCYGAAHAADVGKTCKQRLEKEFENLATANNWRRCPSCRHMVEKVSDLLKVPETATTEQIREAYKREALRTHPDRTTNLGGPNGERPLNKDEATVLFQHVADAYYVLSNPQRRKEYDIARRSRANSWGSPWSTSASGQEQHAEPDTVFGGVFEELLRPEVQNPGNFYSPVGMASGAALGFICGGIPGALIGGYGGKTLGRIRDQKGVSVIEAFGRLEHANKAAIIATLAAKVFQSLQ
ncbi:hypothetical protein BGX23_010506 [Mortierella sp. AD031]|nr:hypothetical protein BGX23_010506 [Mortierella sp. AD031]